MVLRRLNTCSFILVLIIIFILSLLSSLVLVHHCFINWKLHSALLHCAGIKNSPQKASIQHVPRFCSNLKTPPLRLPILTPSKARQELNEIGKYGFIEQDDERITDYLWDHCDIFLRPPNGKPSNWSGPNPSMGQDEVVRKLLGNISMNGFYVECGALDGILSSNTFWFEKEYHWKGLLIEPDPSNLQMLYTNHRNAWISHSCLSTNPYPQEVIFQPNFDLGRISEVAISVEHPEQQDGISKQIRLQCFPFYSYLAALNVSVIDYFSLDIEGDELEVLKTIPFDKLLIKVISVEFLTSKGGEWPLRNFMEANNYITAHKFFHLGIPFDLIFVHKSVNVEPDALEMLVKNL